VSLDSFTYAKEAPHTSGHRSTPAVEDHPRLIFVSRPFGGPPSLLVARCPSHFLSYAFDAKTCTPNLASAAGAQTDMDDALTMSCCCRRGRVALC
jgi:hypothetical protein